MQGKQRRQRRQCKRRKCRRIPSRFKLSLFMHCRVGKWRQLAANRRLQKVRQRRQKVAAAAVGQQPAPKRQKKGWGGYRVGSAKKQKGPPRGWNVDTVRPKVVVVVGGGLTPTSLHACCPLSTHALFAAPIPLQWRVAQHMLVTLALAVMGVPAGWAGQAGQYHALLGRFVGFLDDLSDARWEEMWASEVTCHKCGQSMDIAGYLVRLGGGAVPVCMSRFGAHGRRARNMPHQTHSQVGTNIEHVYCHSCQPDNAVRVRLGRHSETSHLLDICNLAQLAVAHAAPPIMTMEQVRPCSTPRAVPHALPPPCWRCPTCLACGANTPHAPPRPAALSRNHIPPPSIAARFLGPADRVPGAHGCCAPARVDGPCQEGLGGLAVAVS